MAGTGEFMDDLKHRRRDDRRRSTTARTGGPVARDAATFDVRNALTRSGCPVCLLALRAVGRFIDSVAYEQINDPGLRADLRAARGFCNVHAFRWLREARSALGTATIYQDVLRSALAEIDQELASASRGHGRLRALLRSSNGPERIRCPACRVQREAEHRYLSALLQALADPSVAAEFERSDGLCLAHTHQAARLGLAGAEQVLSHTRRAMQQLIGELSEVIRKEDYRFRHEPRSEAERTAPERAIRRAAGAEGLAMFDTQ